MRVIEKFPTESELIGNIAMYYHFAKQKDTPMSWYSETNDFCYDLSKQFNVPIYIVVGLISAFSPLRNWDDNKRIVIDYLKGKKVGCFKSQKSKADRIFNAENEQEIEEILNGRKTVSFFKNIVSSGMDSSVVTIDRHAISIAVRGSFKGSLTDNRYKTIEYAYQRVGAMYGVPAPVVQSVTWECFRVHKFNEELVTI